MPPKARAPSFGSKEYWDQRFTKNTAPFDWLSAPDALDPFIEDALQTVDDTSPQTLHVGCGSSLLSQHLKTYVENAQQIHNVDYSSVVIEVERQREVDMSSASEGERNAGALMRWSAVDLLDYNSVVKTCGQHTYSVIIDKSTSDAVSCADDVVCSLPYAVTTKQCTVTREKVEVEPSKVRVYSLRVMAVHLAIVAKPGAKWVSLSYSAERFSILEKTAANIQKDDASEAGIPDPRLLWTIVGKHQIEAKQQEDSGVNGVTYRPKVYHWVYVLQRTSVPLLIQAD